MPSFPPSVYHNGAWTDVKIVYINDGGIWKPARQISTMHDGFWRTVYPLDYTGFTASQPSTTSGSFVVPNTITRLRIIASGGGGGGGGSLLSGCGTVEHNAGSGGGGAAVVFFEMSVVPGQVIQYTIGAGGGVGAAYDNRRTFAGEGANSGRSGGDTIITTDNVYVVAGGGKPGRAPATGTGDFERVGSNCTQPARPGGAGGVFSLSGVTDLGSRNGGAGGAGGGNGASGGSGESVITGFAGQGGGGSGGAEAGAGGGGGGAANWPSGFNFGAGGNGGRFQTGLGGSGNGSPGGGGGGGMGGQGGGFGLMTTGFGGDGRITILYGVGIN